MQNTRSAEQSAWDELTALHPHPAEQLAAWLAPLLLSPAAESQHTWPTPHPKQ